MFQLFDNFQILLQSWWCDYSQVPFKRGPIYHDITYGTVITVAESEQDFRITTYTPYLTLMSELSGVYCEYHKTSNIRCTLVGNKIVDHSDVVGASPVGAAPTASSFST